MELEVEVNHRIGSYLRPDPSTPIRPETNNHHNELLLLIRTEDPLQLQEILPSLLISGALAHPLSKLEIKKGLAFNETGTKLELLLELIKMLQAQLLQGIVIMLIDLFHKPISYVYWICWIGLMTTWRIKGVKATI